MPKGVFGFIYMVTCKTTGKAYIGRKNIWSVTNKPLTKKELEEQAAQKKPGKKRTTKQVIKEHKWQDYYGSEDDLKKDVKELGKEVFTREILEYTFSAKETTYKELKHQMIHGVLESDGWYNSNILGRFFRKDFATLK